MSTMWCNLVSGSWFFDLQPGRANAEQPKPLQNISQEIKDALANPWTEENLTKIIDFITTLNQSTENDYDKWKETIEELSRRLCSNYRKIYSSHEYVLNPGINSKHTVHAQVIAEVLMNLEDETEEEIKKLLNNLKSFLQLRKDLLKTDNKNLIEVIDNLKELITKTQPVDVDFLRDLNALIDKLPNAVYLTALKNDIKSAAPESGKIQLNELIAISQNLLFHLSASLIDRIYYLCHESKSKKSI